MIKNILLLAGLVCLSYQAYSQTYSTDSGHAEVHGSVPVAPDYIGKSDFLEGTIDLGDNTVDFQLPLSTLKTGNKTRDNHMYDALETSEFPVARFQGNILNFDPEKTKEQQIVVEGDFTIHGQKKFFQIPVTLEKTGADLTFSASFTIFITNFGIERPTAMVLEVDDKHKIIIRGTAKAP